MINLSTPSDELWRVLLEENPKAIYWLKKHFGGDEKYEKMRDKLLRECVRVSKPIASEVVEYTSKEGNRWVCFEQATYYPESIGSHCMPLAFCYYETAASLGLFSIGYLHDDGIDHADAIFIYTPHFFQRFAERMNISGTPRDILMRYIEMTPSFVVLPLPSENEEQEKVAIRMLGCIGIGIMRKEGRNVYEIRTLLTDEQLSSKQAKETKKIRDVGDVLKFEPKEMMEARLDRSGNPWQTMQNDLEKYESVGIDTTAARIQFIQLLQERIKELSENTY